MVPVARTVIPILRLWQIIGGSGLFEKIGDDRGANAAVGFSVEIFRRTLPIVDIDIARDEIDDDLGVDVDAPECLVGVRRYRRRKSRAGRIDKDKIGLVQEGNRIILQGETRWRSRIV